MFFTGINGKTRLMIYIGTLLLSVLSFFTTYYGMTILLDVPLAIIGSLGLQIALLGIAWNLMKIKKNRKTYIAVFTVTAVFSIFFSYANFDINLKANTRAQNARTEYAVTVRPILNEYAATAKEAALKGQYQIERITKLLDIEKNKGWSTIVDEGSGDKFIQSVIDGARRTVESWHERQGAAYKQGSGEGIIFNYLESKLSQINTNKEKINAYVAIVDSLSMEINSSRSVKELSNIVNYARVKFPISETNLIMSTSPNLSIPPDNSNYVEVPQTRQQAFVLVIDDLLEMDALAFFSLILAIAIDFIIIIMAFAGSYSVNDIDDVLNQVKEETASRISQLPYTDEKEFAAALNESMARIQKASEYNLNLYQLLNEYKAKKKKFRFTMKRGSESIDTSPSFLTKKPTPEKTHDVENPLS